MNCSTVEDRAAVVKSDYMLENPVNSSATMVEFFFKKKTMPSKKASRRDNQQERLEINFQESSDTNTSDPDHKIVER